MTIEAIKSELALLEPEVEAAWQRLEELEAEVQPVKNRWFVLNERKRTLESALSILDPKPEEPEKLLV